MCQPSDSKSAIMGNTKFFKLLSSALLWCCLFDVSLLDLALSGVKGLTHADKCLPI